MEPTFRQLLNLLESYEDPRAPNSVGDPESPDDSEEEPDTYDLMKQRLDHDREERANDPHNYNDEEAIDYDINYDDEDEFLLDPEFRRDAEPADDTNWEDQIIDKIDRERQGDYDSQSSWGPGNRTPQQIARDIRSAELNQVPKQQINRQQLKRQYDLNESIDRLRQLANV
jgi:hypothetical protein